MNERLRDADSIARREITAALPGDHTLESITVDFFRDKEEQGTVVGLNVGLGRADGATIERNVVVRWAPVERLVRELDRVVDAHREQAFPLPASVLLEAESCAVTAFPFDRRLPRLTDWLRPRSIVRALEDEGLTGRDGWRVRKRRSEWRVLSYRPERRVVLGWDLPEKNETTGARRTVRCVVRHAAGTITGPADLLDRVARAGVDAPRRIASPDPHTRIESFVAGETGSLHVIWPADVLERVGNAIARWHVEGDHDGLPASDPGRLLRRARASIETIGSFDGATGRRLADRLDVLARSVPDAVPACALHGDLHPGQFVVDGERVALLDWDRAASGDPAEDVANLLVHLDASGAPDDRADAFRRGYEAVASWPDADRLRWHVEAARLRLSDLGIRRPRAVPAGWTASVTALEAEAPR